MLKHFESSCIDVVCRAKVADYLVDKPAGVHVNTLSEQCKVEEGKLGRVLRLLATQHCFVEGTSTRALQLYVL
jgi:hypothetical protein